MRAGDTFLVPGFDDHLWAIISDPIVNADNVVAVMFVSWTEKYDQACILQQGDHPFIKHDTCVNYPAAKIWSDRHLEELRRANVLRMKAPLSSEVLQRIREKAELSDIPARAYGILREQGLAP